MPAPAERVMTQTGLPELLTSTVPVGVPAPVWAMVTEMTAVDSLP